MDNIIDMKERTPGVLAKRMSKHLEGQDLEVAMKAIGALCCGLVSMLDDAGMDPLTLEEFKSDLMNTIFNLIRDIG